jgi:hypothetical protein
MANKQNADLERAYQIAEIEHDQVLIAIKTFALDSFIRGDDRTALIGRDVYRMLDDLRARRLVAVRQRLGLPDLESEAEKIEADASSLIPPTALENAARAYALACEIEHAAVLICDRCDDDDLCPAHAPLREETRRARGRLLDAARETKRTP